MTLRLHWNTEKKLMGVLRRISQILRTIFEKRKKDTGFSGGRVNPSGFSDVCISGSNCESGALYKR